MVAKEVRHKLHMASCLVSFLGANSRLENSGRLWAPLEKENKSLPSLGHPDWPAGLVAHIAWDLPHTPQPDLTGPTGSLLSTLVLRPYFPQNGHSGGMPNRGKIEPNLRKPVF